MTLRELAFIAETCRQRSINPTELAVLCALAETAPQNLTALIQATRTSDAATFGTLQALQTKGFVTRRGFGYLPTPQTEELHRALGRSPEELSRVAAAVASFSRSWAALIVLCECWNAPVVLTSAARQVGVTTGAMTGIADRLTTTGLADRVRSDSRPGSGDRRTTHLALTDQGRAALQKLTQSLREPMPELIA